MNRAERINQSRQKRRNVRDSRFSHGRSSILNSPCIMTFVSLHESVNVREVYNTTYRDLLEVEEGERSGFKEGSKFRQVISLFGEEKKSLLDILEMIRF